MKITLMFWSASATGGVVPSFPTEKTVGRKSGEANTVEITADPIRPDYLSD